MDLTAFILEDKHYPLLARPYMDAGTPDVFYYYNTLPAGGLFSNANDMARPLY
jgi:CubicO group peptidase (beta-lactamase class C family)